MPKISAIIPAYNAEKYIEDAINSILNQTYADFELIVINDGSTDRTKDIILSFDDPRMVYLENKQNSGIVVTLNKGLSYAKSEYIARMDADDIAMPERFAKQVEYLDSHPSVGVLGTAVRIFGDGIKSYDRVFTTNPAQLKAELFFSSCVSHPTVMIRRSIVVDNDLSYDERFAGREDYALWWNMAKYCDVTTLPDVLHQYRVHANQITKQVTKAQSANQRLFFNYRMRSLGLSFPEEHENALLGYCLGKYSEFDVESMKSFRKAVHVVTEMNKKKQFFSSHEWRKVCSLAIIYISNESHIAKKAAWRNYTDMLLDGDFSVSLYFKSIFHDMKRIILR